VLVRQAVEIRVVGVDVGRRDGLPHRLLNPAEQLRQRLVAAHLRRAAVIEVEFRAGDRLRRNDHAAAGDAIAAKWPVAEQPLRQPVGASNSPAPARPERQHGGDGVQF
jgi:hypothetical protein